MALVIRTRNGIQEFRKMITYVPILTHSDPNRPIILSCDASKDAVGAVILCDKHPIAFASKSSSDSKKKYAQIEKELYAIYFGCVRFEPIRTMYLWF